MVDTFNPTRLGLARRRRGKTKTSLAKDIGHSVRVFNAYESGDYEPSSLTIDRLAEVLDFPASFFFGPSLDEPPLEGSSFRALSRLTARVRDKALAAGTIALALSDWIEARFSLPEPTVPTYQGIDPETASIAVRSEWGRGERPIRNMIHLLEAHGVRVFSLAEDCSDLDAFSFWRNNVPYIFLNTIKSAERRRMDAAHELGHLILHWKGGARGRTAEYEATQFGSALLMPLGSVIAEAPKGGRLDQLIKAKRRWNVSVANLAVRMHRLQMLSSWQYRSIFVQLGSRTKEPNSSKAETSHVLASVFRKLREEGISIGQIANELNVHQDELSQLVFRLVLTSLSGGKDSRSRVDASNSEGKVRLIQKPTTETSTPLRHL